MNRIVVKTIVETGETGSISDFLAVRAGLPKARIKDAMQKGAVWLRSKKGGLRRLRRASAVLPTGDSVEFYYDAALLARVPPQAVCLHDLRAYSVWHKPAGLLAQGTKYGDHCSLLRQAEVFFRPARQVFLVHRLDREAAGLMLIAHTRAAAARLSLLFQKNRISKVYQVVVAGDLAAIGPEGSIDLPLDGKTALTEYKVLGYDPQASTTAVEVRLKTGRFHQIRRHFAMLGYPVMGDPRYGTGNKNEEGMQLVAIGLSFICPYQKRAVFFRSGQDDSRQE